MAEWEASGRFEFQAGRAAARAVAAARGVGLGLVCAQGAVGAEVSRSDGGGNGPGAAARGVQPAAGGAPEAGGRRRPVVAGRDPRGGGQDVRQVTSTPPRSPLLRVEPSRQPRAELCSPPPLQPLQRPAGADAQDAVAEEPEEEEAAVRSAGREPGAGQEEVGRGPGCEARGPVAGPSCCGPF